MNNQTKTICFVAGKSAGHILPALTIAQNYQAQNPNLKVIFISNQTALDYQALNQNPLVDQHWAINLMPVPQKVWQLPKFGWQLLRAFCQALFFLKKNRPQQIISTGGLIAIPICWAAKLLNYPFIIYELNVEPGKTTKLLAKIATQVKICFAKTANYLATDNLSLISYPNRFNFQDYQLTKSQALAIIKLKNVQFELNQKTILILGGSQGSVFINQTIQKLILQAPELIKDCQFIHQTGHHDQTDWPAFYQKAQIPAIVFSYETNLMPYYKLADLIICRAGAGTLAEIIPLNSACITIPLQTSINDHQVFNAIELAQNYPQIKVLKQNEITQNFNLFIAQFQAQLAFVAPKFAPSAHLDI